MFIFTVISTERERNSTPVISTEYGWNFTPVISTESGRVSGRCSGEISRKGSTQVMEYKKCLR